MSYGRGVDKWFLWTTITLVVIGLFIFFSASMGLLAREGGASFSRVAFKQLVVGVFGGFLLLSLMSRIHYAFWRKYSFFIFLGSIFLTALVFVPGIGFSHGGATRWIGVGSFTFQPAEVLKFGFVVYFAAWASGVKAHIKTLKFGLLPVGIMLGVVALLLVNQPDNGTFLVLMATAVGMYIVAGAAWKHLFGLFVAGFVAAGVLVFAMPYVQDRIMTFLHPERDALGSGYQIRQSLIAIGSGEFFGRGFGQSIQKFNFLPEPVGDSIFAVAAEEFGFLGGVVLIGLFLLFALRGFVIAAKAPDVFARLLTVGTVILIISQSFINIASMLAIFPLTGMPLLFVSHGGTAMAIALAEVGVVLNISRRMKP